MALSLKICPSLLYAPENVTKWFVMGVLCSLRLGGELTNDQMQDLDSVIQMLKNLLGDGPLPDRVIKSIASKLKIDPECFRRPRIIKNTYLLMCCVLSSPESA